MSYEIFCPISQFTNSYYLVLMKYFIRLLMSFTFLPLWSQGGTEVYTAKLNLTQAGYRIEELSNQSQNLGYDNQPSFWSEDALLYAATQNGQTDIIFHQLATGEKNGRSATGQGSEYSPLRIPSTDEYSAIRLDTTGLQRLYRYNTQGESSPLHPDLKIGYHVWVDATTLLCTVLVENHMDLYHLNIENGKATRLQTHVGRSLHLIPNSTELSFIHWKEEQAIITSIDLATNTQKPCFVLPSGVQDHAWLPNGDIVYGQGSTLFRAMPSGTAQELHRFSSTEIKNISRIAISPSGKRIALVGEE